MKNHIAKLVILILLGGGLSIYWQMRNVDPEGACKGLNNLSMCWDAWMEYDHDELFRKLQPDQEMIDNFKKYRGDFDAIKEKVISQQNYYMSFVNSDFRKQTGVWWVGAFGYWPSTVYSNYLMPREGGRKQEFALSFSAEGTMYIAGAEKNWPKINRQKGYAYFPLPIPRIEQGRLLGPMLNGQKLSWRVLEQLDKDWPTDWASYECLLRPIEPQWFLFICKDHIGG